MAAVKYWFRKETDRARRLVGLFGLIAAAVVFPAAGVGEQLDELAPATVDLVTASLDPGNSDSAALSARLRKLDRFAARFTQAIAGSQGQILEQSAGQVLLLKPRFKWVVDDPYPQIIVTEGDQLKVYDPDLEQLIVRPLDEALKDTPISLLTRDDVMLGEDFLIVRLPTEQGESYAVSPRSSDSLFAEIRLTFDEAGLTSLGILDHLGQYTEIRFEVDPDRVIQSADFELEVPPDTDVIGG